MRLLTDEIVEAIAQGQTVRRKDVAPSTRLTIRHRGAEVILTRRSGANGWMVTGYKLDSPGELTAGFDTGQTTQTTPTLARRGLGAAEAKTVAFSRAVNTPITANTPAVRKARSLWLDTLGRAQFAPGAWAHGKIAPVITDCIFQP